MKTSCHFCRWMHARMRQCLGNTGALRQWTRQRFWLIEKVELAANQSENTPSSSPTQPLEHPRLLFWPPLLFCRTHPSVLQEFCDHPHRASSNPPTPHTTCQYLQKVNCWWLWDSCFVILKPFITKQSNSKFSWGNGLLRYSAKIQMAWGWTDLLTWQQ